MFDQHIILDLEMNPTEFTGGRKKRLPNEIIEIGAVRLDAGFNVADTFSCFVEPEFSSCVSRDITILTGITSSDIHNAAAFEAALPLFEKWIGGGRTRIYSWSDNDLKQLRKECMYKRLAFPGNMKRWIDLQAVFPRMMDIGYRRRRMPLADAAGWGGVEIDSKSVHRALYDAQVTACLARLLLTGEYIDKKKLLSAEEPGNGSSGGVLIGDIYGDVLSQLLLNIRSEGNLSA